MTETVDSFNVTAAFHSQLNTLCIREFPCGHGSWVSYNIWLVFNMFFSVYKQVLGVKFWLYTCTSE